MFNILFRVRKDVEAQGYHIGTQEYPESEVLINPARDGLKASFEKQMEEAELASSDRINRLGAQVETLHREKIEAGTIRERMEGVTRVGPPFLKALIGIVAAVFGILGEALYLGPVLEGQGIANREEQLFVALVIVVTAAILIKITVHRLFPPDEVTLGDQADDDEKRHLRRWLPAVVTASTAIFTISLLAMLGLWRAEELIFSASLDGDGESSLGRFLGENPTLTKICVVLLTVALPIAAAWALEWGLRQLHFAWQWRRARRIHIRRGRQLDNVTKKLQAEREKLTKRKEALACRRDEWIKALEEQYELGRRIRARRLPFWWVILKIAMVAALLFALCALAAPFISMWIVDEALMWVILITGWIGLSGVYAMKALHAWERPNPSQLYKQQAVIWRDEALLPGPQVLTGRQARELELLSAAEDRARLNGSAAQQV